MKKTKCLRTNYYYWKKTWFRLGLYIIMFLIEHHDCDKTSSKSICQCHWCNFPWYQSVNSWYELELLFVLSWLRNLLYSATKYFLSFCIGFISTLNVIILFLTETFPQTHLTSRWPSRLWRYAVQKTMIRRSNHRFDFFLFLWQER